MALGTWRSPFPLRFGGNTHQRVTVFYETVKAARPTMLRGEDGSEVDLENKVMARMLAAAWRDTERRVAQRDPRKLSELARLVTLPDGTQRTMTSVERWERVLGLVPARDASPRERRLAIFGAVVSTSSTRRSAVETAMRGLFGSWYLGLGENDVDDVDYPGRSPTGSVSAHWPTTDPGGVDAFHTSEYPGTYHADWSWRSGLCILAVLIRPPATVAQATVDVLAGKALQVLDDMLPAWMSATVSQLAPESTEAGFFAGVSLVGLTAI
jgi:hypothetical protein